MLHAVSGTWRTIPIGGSASDAAGVVYVEHVLTPTHIVFSRARPNCRDKAIADRGLGGERVMMLDLSPVAFNGYHALGLAGLTATR